MIGFLGGAILASFSPDIAVLNSIKFRSDHRSYVKGRDYEDTLSHPLHHIARSCAFTSPGVCCTQRFARSSDIDRPELNAV